MTVELPSVLKEKRARLQELLGGWPCPRGRLRFGDAVRGPGPARWRAVSVTGCGPALPGLLSLPARGTPPFPAVLYCHAHGFDYATGKSELRAGRPALADPPYGAALAEIGVAALCIDMRLFGERSGEEEGALAKAALWSGRPLFGAMLRDQAAALAALADLTEIDGGRLGVLGLSMGGTLALWLAALEPRLKAVAHLCCFADLATLIDSGAHDLHGHYMTVPGLTALCSTADIAGMAAPRPQLVCIGGADPLTPPAAAAVALDGLRAHYDRAGAADSLHVIHEAAVGHRESETMRAATLAFLGTL